MEQLFLIDGYWKDNKRQFNGYLVSSNDDSEDDDEVFFYGLSEEDIKEEIDLGEQTTNEFVITSYTKA